MEKPVMSLNAVQPSWTHSPTHFLHASLRVITDNREREREREMLKQSPFKARMLCFLCLRMSSEKQQHGLSMIEYDCPHSAIPRLNGKDSTSRFAWPWDSTATWSLEHKGSDVAM